MSVELHDKLIALLGEVESLKAQETTIKADKLRHLEAISAAQSEVSGCNNTLEDIRENQFRLRREMDSLRDELFKRDDDKEEVIAEDTANVTVTEYGVSGESTGKKMWNAAKKELALKAIQ
jgi:chromosome segregation ATPase